MQCTVCKKQFKYSEIAHIYYENDAPKGVCKKCYKDYEQETPTGGWVRKTANGRLHVAK